MQGKSKKQGKEPAGEISVLRLGESTLAQDEAVDLNTASQLVKQKSGG